MVASMVAVWRTKVKTNEVSVHTSHIRLECHRKNSSKTTSREPAQTRFNDNTGKQKECGP